VLRIQAEVDVALVVFEDDVVARPVFLDEVVLEDQGFLLGPRHHEVDALRARHQELDGGATVTAFAEIVLHARAQRLCFAHIKHPAVLVPEEVHPGVGREAVGLLPESVGNAVFAHSYRSSRAMVTR
jgi:hypothetical protein